MSPVISTLTSSVLLAFLCCILPYSALGAEKVGCPTACSCSNEEIRCQTVPKFWTVIPETIKRLSVASRDLSCEDDRILSLLEIAVKNRLELGGYCRRRDQLQILTLNELVGDYLVKESQNRMTRTKRATSNLSRSNYSLSLINGNNDLEGTIVVRQRNADREGTICVQQWSQAEADVACRQLGYLSATPNRVTATKVTTRLVYVSQLTCSGDESILDECNVTTVVPSRTCWRSTPAATAHCQIDRTLLTAGNTAAQCSFYGGLCGWSNRGPWAWSWHGTLYHPGSISSKFPYMYLYKSPKIERNVWVYLDSPPLALDPSSNEIYISYSAAKYGNPLLAVTIHIGYMGQSQIRGLDIPFANMTTTWGSYMTPKVPLSYKSGNFYVKIYAVSDAQNKFGTFAISNLTIHGAVVAKENHTVTIIIAASSSVLVVFFIVLFVIHRQQTKPHAPVEYSHSGSKASNHTVKTSELSTDAAVNNGSAKHA